MRQLSSKCTGHFGIFTPTSRRCLAAGRRGSTAVIISRPCWYSLGSGYSRQDAGGGLGECHCRRVRLILALLDREAGRPVQPEFHVPPGQCCGFRSPQTAIGHHSDDCQVNGCPGQGRGRRLHASASAALRKAGSIPDPGLLFATGSGRRWRDRQIDTSGFDPTRHRRPAGIRTWPAAWQHLRGSARLRPLRSPRGPRGRGGQPRQMGGGLRPLGQRRR